LLPAIGVLMIVISAFAPELSAARVDG